MPIHFFYGWWIIGALFLISAYLNGIIFLGFTAVFEPIVYEYNWSYAQVSFGASMCWMSGLLAPLVGAFVDRWGPRKIIFGALVIIGAGLLLLSRINSLSMFYGVCLLLGVGMVGCMDTVPATVTINWFRKKASIAMGIMLCGPAVGGLLVPLVTRTIDTFDWRVAMVIFGTGAWVLLLPLSLLIRHRPEQYGYLPDGEVIKEHVIHEEETPSQVNEIAIGLRQALKSRPFRHIALGLICHMCVINSVIVHVMPYLSSIGIARTTSSFIASSIPLISIAGRLSFGWLGDKLDKRRITTLGFAMLSLSMVCFGFSSAVGIWLIIPFLILFGIGYGGPIPVMLTLLREHFGRARFGSILGIIIGGALLAGMIGAPLAGWVFDSFGSYTGAWFGFAVITIVGMLSILTTPPSAKTG